jgi:hypothetical protein
MCLRKSVSRLFCCVMLARPVPSEKYSGEDATRTLRWRDASRQDLCEKYDRFQAREAKPV